MREKHIEQCLVRDVKASGGICLKLVSPGTDGPPFPCFPKRRAGRFSL